jgi:hypothetical protein
LDTIFNLLQRTSRKRNISYRVIFIIKTLGGLSQKAQDQTDPLARPEGLAKNKHIKPTIANGLILQ